MCWHGTASGKKDCHLQYSEAAIQLCLTIKGLVNLALRKAMGMVQSLLKLAGLDWQVPDFSTVSRRQKHRSVTTGAQPTTAGLHLLVNSTGIKMLGEGEWNAQKKSMGPAIVDIGARPALALTRPLWKSGLAK